jgi:uncharacterized membrane protein YqaE (UPF0057 family)
MAQETLTRLLGSFFMPLVAVHHGRGMKVAVVVLRHVVWWLFVVGGREGGRGERVRVWQC